MQEVYPIRKCYGSMTSFQGSELSLADTVTVQ